MLTTILPLHRLLLFPNTSASPHASFPDYKVFDMIMRAYHEASAIGTVVRVTGICKRVHNDDPGISRLYGNEKSMP